MRTGWNVNWVSGFISVCPETCMLSHNGAFITLACGSGVAPPPSITLKTPCCTGNRKGILPNLLRPLRIAVEPHYDGIYAVGNGIARPILQQALITYRMRHVLRRRRRRTGNCWARAAPVKNTPVKKNTERNVIMRFIMNPYK